MRKDWSASLATFLNPTAVRPVRPGGHGSAWGALEECHAQIKAWADGGLTVVKIGVLLERQGITVPYRTLHRFCAERCGFGRTATTVRVADGEPGADCQLDFGYMGMLLDPVTGRRGRPAIGPPKTRRRRSSQRVSPPRITPAQTT